MATQTNSTSSFPIFGLLGVLFIGLKLTGYISWSWWWVLLPFWGGWALAAALVFVAGLITVLNAK